VDGADADPIASPAVEVRDLTKSFRTGHLRPVYRPALKGLTFSVARGEVFGYLGPNGSGKTTTLKILLGLLFPDGGSATILGHPEWADDDRFATNPARVAARDTLVPVIERIFATKPAAEWLPLLEAAGIPAGPINSISQALADPQAQFRGARIDRDGGALGKVPLVGSPIRLDGQRQDADLPPPALGEHGDLLAKYCDKKELKRLRAAGVVS